MGPFSFWRHGIGDGNQPSAAEADQQYGFKDAGPESTETMPSQWRCKRFSRVYVSQHAAFIHSGNPGVAAASASIAIVAATKTGDLTADNTLKAALLRAMDVQ